MKVVIFAGGMGTRLSEETQMIPKPMIEIGGKPILWHIMNWYGQFGFNDFIICLGYKGYVIKEYFFNYFLHRRDLTIDLEKNELTYYGQAPEPWKVTLVDTGLHTQTGGRLKRVQEFIGNERFFLTYGDGVSDVDLSNLLKHHIESKKIGTLTAVRPAPRWGVLKIDGQEVTGFSEKSDHETTLINGGFFVLEPQVFSYLEGDTTVLEKEPLELLTREHQLGAYIHHGFWKAMDTLRDKVELEMLFSQKHDFFRKSLS